MTKEEIIKKAAMELFLAHNPKGNPNHAINIKIIDGFKKDVEILMLFFDLTPKK